METEKRQSTTASREGASSAHRLRTSDHHLTAPGVTRHEGSRLAP